MHCGLALGMKYVWGNSIIILQICALLLCINCTFLISQLSEICRSLDRLWLDGQGSVILYEWQQLLVHETLSLLHITSKLVVDVETSLPKMTNWDNRAVQEIEHVLLVLPTLVEYDAKRKEKGFKTSVFTCDICFQSLLGDQCVQVPACQHVHCCECLRGHITAKIGEGQVVQIDCPSVKCSEMVPPSVIKDLVTPVLFARYDQLLLQRSLEGMGDIVYCPRPTCRCASLKEQEDDKMAICSRCRFSFCVLCKRTWHGIAPCKLLPDDIRALKEMYENGDNELRRSLEQQYGKRQLEKALAELESTEWIKSNSKPCPNCKSSIEKSHGCNKMTCSRCGRHFCWLCQTELDRSNPYRHFHFGASACGGKLFDGMDTEEEIWE